MIWSLEQCQRLAVPRWASLRTNRSKGFHQMSNWIETILEWFEFVLHNVDIVSVGMKRRYFPVTLQQQIGTIKAKKKSCFMFGWFHECWLCCIDLICLFEGNLNLSKCVQFNCTTVNPPHNSEKVEALLKSGGSSLWEVPLFFPNYGKLTVYYINSYLCKNNQLKMFL